MSKQEFSIYHLRILKSCQGFHLPKSFIGYIYICMQAYCYIFLTRAHQTTLFNTAFKQKDVAVIILHDLHIEHGFLIDMLENVIA